MIEKTISLAVEATVKGVQIWREAFSKLSQDFIAEYSLGKVIKQVQNPKSVLGARYLCQENVDMWWKDKWFRAKVFVTHNDNTVSIEFEDEAHKGVIERRVPWRHLRHSPKSKK